MNPEQAVPAPVSGLLEDRMWQSIARQAMELPFCPDCARAVYPPAPCCPHCLRFDLPWRKLSGRGRIVSWTRFHRTYLTAYPAPYNVIVVALDEGATMVSNLVAPGIPESQWIGQPASMVYVDAGGRLLPRFELAEDPRQG